MVVMEATHILSSASSTSSRAEVNTGDSISETEGLYSLDTDRLLLTRLNTVFF